jgi:hypothetical protein
VDDLLLYFAAVRGSNTPYQDPRKGALTSCGAEGNRTPDLLDANETRYQLRYSPAGAQQSLAVGPLLLASCLTVARFESRR